MGTGETKGSHVGKIHETIKKNIGVTYIDEFGWLRNYRYGISFLEIKSDDPQAAVKCIWNYMKRYQDNDRFVPLYGSSIDRNCRHIHYKWITESAHSDDRQG